MSNEITNDEFMEKYKKLYIWEQYYYKNKWFYSNDDLLIDEKNIKSIINDTSVYNQMFKTVSEQLKIKDDPVLVFKLPYYLNKNSHNEIFEKLVNPGYLDNDTVQKLKRMRNKDVEECLYIKAIIYVHTMSRLMTLYYDEITVPVHLWMLYLIKLYKNNIKNPKHKDYLNNYLNIDTWFRSLVEADI